MKRCGLALVLLCSLSAAPAADAAAQVSGQVVAGRGMTVLALSPGGTAVRQKVPASGAFRLRLPSARGATLQLVGRDGRYYGPVVLRHEGRRAFTALAGRSAAVGAIRLRSGYGVAVRPLGRERLDRRSISADKTGRPLGAGRLGVVRTGRGSFASVFGLDLFAEAPGQPGADTDSDGVPNAVDADDNGNLVLDNVDPSTPSSNGLFTTLYLGFSEALNVNAGNVGSAQIDAVLAGENRFNLIFFFDARQVRERTVTGAHVNCFALPYCRRGDGTAILSGLSESSPSLPRGSRWVEYSPDGSGYPNLERMRSHDGNDVWAAGVQPRIGTSGIRPGDTYDVVFGTSGGPVSVPTTLAGYFVTTPALTAYSSGSTSGTVSYPVSANAPGTDSNPIKLGSGSVTLSFWRPQRLAIAGAESGQYVDMGHLRYGVMPEPQGVQMTQEIGCGGLYSGVSPDLEAVPATDPFAASFWPFRDRSDDAAPSASRTLSLTLDVAGCLQRAGIEPAGRTVRLNLTATSEPRPGGADRAVQTVTVRLP